MPIRKNRFPRRPVFIMDSSDEDDDEVARLSPAVEATPFHKEDEIPIDLSVKPSGLVSDKVHFLNGNSESRISNGVFNGSSDGNGHHHQEDDDDDEEDEDGERSDSGPPPLGEPYVTIPSPLELKFLKSQRDLEDEDEPQDLSTRSRGPPLYGSSPSASSPSSSSSLLSISSYDSSLAAHRTAYGTHRANGTRPPPRYASDPHLRHHKRERLEEMVNHLRRRTSTSGLTVAIDDQLSPHHPSLMHRNSDHDSVIRSNSCSSLRQQSYMNHRNGHDVPPQGNSSSQHERLLACLAKPPLKDPMHGLDPNAEAEGIWRPEDIFLLPANGDQNYIANNEDMSNKHAYPHPHYSPNSFLHRVMSSSLSLMAAMPPGEAFLRHFQNAPPSYLPLMAYNYYAQLMQLGQYAATNGNGNSQSPPFPGGKVPKSPKSSSPVSPSASAGSDRPSMPMMMSPRLNDNGVNGKTDAILSPPLLSPNSNNMADIPRKRAPRALTGKHVKHGTGASPSTLLTLRQKIEQRQRIRQVVGDFRPPVKSRGPPPKRKQPASS